MTTTTTPASRSAASIAATKSSPWPMSSMSMKIGDFGAADQLLVEERRRHRSVVAAAADEERIVSTLPKSGRAVPQQCGSRRVVRAQRSDGVEDAMIFEQIPTGGCQSYLVGCDETCAAALIDPELSQIDRYLALAASEACASTTSSTPTPTRTTSRRRASSRASSARRW